MQGSPSCTDLIVWVTLPNLSTTHTLTRTSMFSMLGCNVSRVCSNRLFCMFLLKAQHLLLTFTVDITASILEPCYIIVWWVNGGSWSLQNFLCFESAYNRIHLLRMFRKKNDFLPRLDLLRVMTTLQSQRSQNPILKVAKQSNPTKQKVPLKFSR